MKLSPAAELAIRGVVVLAEYYGQGPTTLKTICEERGLPKQYLVKLFSQLAKADIVTAIRGKRGGYAMARDPKTVTLLDVVEAIEGPLALNFCQYTPPKCEQIDCPVRPMWTELQGVIRRKLSSMTIGGCAAIQPRKPRP
jgi:Rrf2 family protein